MVGSVLEGGGLIISGKSAAAADFVPPLTHSLPVLFRLKQVSDTLYSNYPD